MKEANTKYSSEAVLRLCISTVRPTFSVGIAEVFEGVSFLIAAVVVRVEARRGSGLAAQLRVLTGERQVRVSHALQPPGGQPRPAHLTPAGQLLGGRRSPAPPEHKTCHGILSRYLSYSVTLFRAGQRGGVPCPGDRGVGQEGGGVLALAQVQAGQAPQHRCWLAQQLRGVGEFPLGGVRVTLEAEGGFVLQISALPGSRGWGHSFNY